jgi:hypothetical protein
LADSSADWTIASRMTFLRGQRRAVGLVLVHQPGQQFLIERAPVDADAHRLVVRIAISMMSANCLSFLSLKPTLPGLMRYFASASAQAG